jgi:hypothetical protein
MFGTRIEQNLITIVVGPSDTRAQRAAIDLLDAMTEATRAGRKILVSPDRYAAEAVDQAALRSRQT